MKVRRHDVIYSVINIIIISINGLATIVLIIVLVIMSHVCTKTIPTQKQPSCKKGASLCKKGQEGFTWTIDIKLFATYLPSQPFLGHDLYFKTCIEPHPFFTAGCFEWISYLFAIKLVFSVAGRRTQGDKFVYLADASRILGLFPMKIQQRLIILLLIN